MCVCVNVCMRAHVNVSMKRTLTVSATLFSGALSFLVVCAFLLLCSQLGGCGTSRAKISNIEATEDAKQKLLWERMHKKEEVSEFVPTNMAVNYMQHNRCEWPGVV